MATLAVWDGGSASWTRVDMCVHVHMDTCRCRNVSLCAQEHHVVGAFPTWTRDFSDGEGLNRSFLETSQLFQAPRDH